jgi:MoaA/NifB/PqqE/SkfB family radical SAM enzyme
MKASTKLTIGARILASRLRGAPRPFFVQYSLLNGCNARCVYCNSPARDDSRLSLDEHRRILGEFARLGTVRVKFLGGEPLLVPEMDELVAEVRRRGMRCAMVTNGFLIPERMEMVRQLDEIVISLDGSEAAHDRQRGRGSWKRVMHGVEACAEAGLDFFLSAVVTRESSGEVDWLIDTARRFGVMVNFQIPQFNQEMYGAAARDWMPAAAEIRAIVGRIIAAKEAGAPVLFTARSYRHTLGWHDFSLERVERPGERSPCSAGRYFVQMEPNGDIYPCVLHVGTFQPKNAVREGVEAAWRHAQHHSCFDCYNTWLNENKAIFDLRPEVLGNFWRNYLRARPVSGVSTRPGEMAPVANGQRQPV